MELLPQDISQQTGRQRSEYGALSWPELIARLGAARDLRAVMQSRAPAAEQQKTGSFDTEVARHIARRENNEWPINRDGLAAEKPKAAISVRAVKEAADNNRDA